MKQSIIGIIKECGYGVLYPFVALISLFYTPKAYHNPRAKKGTIVLVFCWFSPNTSHYKWVSYLEKKGFRTYLLNVPLLYESYQASAKRIEKFVIQHKLEKYTLVGISNGALVCLYFIQQRNQWKKIHRFISIGGPLQGTPRAKWIAFSKKGKDMLPGSAFIKKLMSKPIRSRKMITISASYDELVPKQYSSIKGVRSYELRVWGHNKLHLNNKKTYELISKLAV